MRNIILIFSLMIPLISSAKINVVGTIPDYAAIAAEIGGERVKAKALIKGTQDPHFADAKPSHIVRMNRADLLIFTGLGLESGWLPALLIQSRNSKILAESEGYLDASTVARLKDIPSKVDKAMGDVHAGGNPHYYTSPDELFRIAKVIHNKLVQIDPEGKKYYDSRWQIFEQKYKTKSAQWRQKLEPIRGVKIIEYHESWLYLIEWLKFEAKGALEPKPGIPPSPKHVSKLLMKTKSEGIKFIFQEVYYPTSLSKIFAKKSGAKLLVLPSMVGGKEEIKTIWDKFDYIVNEVTK